MSSRGNALTTGRREAAAVEKMWSSRGIRVEDAVHDGERQAQVE